MAVRPRAAPVNIPTAHQPVLKAGWSWRAIRSSLRFRLLFLIIGVALVSLLVSILIILGFQRSQLLANTHTATTALSKLVEANLLNAMRSDDWYTVNEIIRVALQERAIDSLRVLNLEGRVIAASHASEIGSSFNIQDQLCQQCHAAGNQTLFKLGSMDATTGQQMLTTMNLIYNQPRCWACHSVDQKLLGLMIVETPLTMINNQLVTGFWYTALVALIACALLVVLLVPLLNRNFLRPVETLSKGVNELASGNLDYEVQAESQDELGKLAESFDHMRQQLKESYLDIARREKESNTLYEIGTKISSSRALTELLNAAASAARQLLDADVALVGLYDEETHEIVVKAASGARPQAHQDLRMPTSPGNPGSALLEGLPVIIEADDNNNLLQPEDAPEKSEKTVSILAVPLKLGDKFLGMIKVMSRQQRQFSQRDALLLMRLAHPVVISIENAQLYHQLRHLATLEERDRLAREMHDHLAQLMGYINVRAAMTDELLARGRLEDAQDSLTELRRAAKMAYTDVREEIFNLRTSVTPNIGLLPTLKKYLSEYSLHYGLETELLYDDEALTQFPSEIASQVLRIIQEALTNVRKHSHANLVQISFQGQHEHVYIQVQDNGQGFYSGAQMKPEQHYGLQIMRERAESVGGSLRLDSKPGQGTRVTVCVPRYSKN